MATPVPERTVSQSAEPLRDVDAAALAAISTSTFTLDADEVEPPPDLATDKIAWTVTLDAESYPHILDAIINAAPYSLLLALRGTSRTMRARIDKLLLYHVLLYPDGDHLNRYGVASRRGSHGRIPILGSLKNLELMGDVKVADLFSVKGSLTSFFGRTFRPSILRGWDASNISLYADRQIIFVEPHYPVDWYYPAPSTLVDDLGLGRGETNTLVIQLPIPMSFCLSLGHAPFILNDSIYAQIVFRRRSKPLYTRSLSPNADRQFASAIASIFTWSDKVPKIILVDYEATSHDPEATAPPAGEYTRDMLEQNCTSWHAHLAYTNVIFMSMDEYRCSIGEEAFRLEEDDHEFRFGDSALDDDGDKEEAEAASLP